jgi:hypothetical protein
VHYYYFPLSFFLSRSPVFAQTFAPGLLAAARECIIIIILSQSNPCFSRMAVQNIMYACNSLTNCHAVELL